MFSSPGLDLVRTFRARGSWTLLEVAFKMAAHAFELAVAAGVCMSQRGSHQQTCTGRYREMIQPLSKPHLGRRGEDHDLCKLLAEVQGQECSAGKKMKLNDDVLEPDSLNAVGSDSAKFRRRRLLVIGTDKI